MSENPFQLVHAKIWSLLKADTEFTALVPESNRVTQYDYANRDNMPEDIALNVIDSSYPVVRVVSTGKKPNNLADSATRFIGLKWAIQVNVNVHNIAKMAELDWAIFHAMYDWESALTSMSWGGENYVTDSYLIDSDEALNPQDNKAWQRWISVWTGFTQLKFSKTLLVNLGGT